MTRNEFSEILNRTHKKAIEKMHKNFAELSESEKLEMGTLMAELSLSAVEAAEDAILHALEEAGFLSFSG